MVTRAAQIHQATQVAHVTPYDPAFQFTAQSARAALATQVGLAQASPMADAMIYKSLIQQSYMLAYVDDFRWLAVMRFVASERSFSPKRQEKEKNAIISLDTGLQPY